GLRHRLFYNNAGRSFTDVSDTVEVDKGPGKPNRGLREGGAHASKGLGVLLIDLNNDGKPEIYVANDIAAKFLYFNQSTPGHLKVVERGVESGTAGDNSGSPEGSMGVDAADYDGTGLPLLFVTNCENQRHALYHNDWKPGTPPERHFFSYR